MAGFSKKVGYHIESSPKLNAAGNPMRTASGKIKTVETVTGREGDPEQAGVRLLVTKARQTSHIRKLDGKKINDVYLTILKANDATSSKFMGQISARPELRNDAIIVHNKNKLDVRYQHEIQFSYPEGESNDKLDLISEYAIDENGNASSVEELLAGNVSCLAFNAAVRPYRLPNADWQKRREKAAEKYPGKVVPNARNMYTSFSVVLERDADGKGLYMSKPTIPPDLKKHERATKNAADAAAAFSKQVQTPSADVEVAAPEENAEFDNDFGDLEL